MKKSRLRKIIPVIMSAALALNPAGGFWANKNMAEAAETDNATIPGLVEIQTSAYADVKKKSVLIPETTADKDYNKAVVSLECADDVTFNEFCSLVIVVTVNGEEKTFSQQGTGGWEAGWKGSYSIEEGFSIKKDDTYKIEAYTDSWEDHVSSYVYKAGAELSFQETSGGDDVIESGLVEIQTSANADVKKKAVLIPETTAGKDYNKAVVSLECADDVTFNEFCSLVIVVTVNGEEKTFSQQGTGGWEAGWKGSYSIEEGFSIKKDDTYKIEAYTDSWEDHVSSYVYKAGAELSFQETSGGDDVIEPGLVEIQTSANADVKKKAVLIPETTAGKDYNKAVVSLECADDVTFNEFCSLVIVVTINGEEKTFSQQGTGGWEAGWKGSYSIEEGFSIKKDDTYKIEAYTDSWEDHASSYVYKAGAELSFQETSGGDDNTDNNNPGDDNNPGDITESGLVEIQTSANADVKKKAVLIPETTADKDYNKAVISLECADDVTFNEYSSLVIVVTINGEEKTFSQQGTGGWETGWKGSYNIEDGLSIKKDDIYKIEAYTDSWEDHTSGYVYKAGAKLSYDTNEEKPPVDTETGKIYCSTEDNLKLAVIMADSVALKDFNSLKIQVQCASDTSFNPWTSINFVVSINGKKYEKEIKGDDETYTNGALRSCVLDGFTVKKDDTISINAYTYSWNDAADYVFKLSIEDVDSFVKLSDKPSASNTPRPVIAYNPGITASSAPAETQTPEATAEPSSTPATPSPAVTSAPTSLPTFMPADATNAPVTSTEAPATPGNTETPETSPSATPGQTDAGNTSGNGKENTKNINVDGVKYTVTNNIKNTVEYTQKTKNTANVKVPASIKVKVDGKTVTYKVTSIAANAFKNNTKLKKVIISKNIVKIGNNAFKGCKNLKTIKINSKKLTSKNVAKKAFNSIGDTKKVIVKVPKSKYKDYKKLFMKKGLGKKAVIQKY